jgi:DNA (cytosine-5)-methyltransferase 1
MMDSVAFYNENDPYPAKWLRNLIGAGHISPGYVDERDIQEVSPNDIKQYTRAHFFAGIGTWDYALKLAEWPDNQQVWTGSCPCQPFSTAGKRGGTDDSRHLWPEWFRLIRECKPTVIFGEQVASKDGLAWLDIVYSDLESEGYAVAAVDLCAAGIGAPHIRQRLYFVAESIGERWGGRSNGHHQSENGGVVSEVETSRSESSNSLGYSKNDGRDRRGLGNQESAQREAFSNGKNERRWRNDITDDGTRNDDILANTKSAGQLREEQSQDDRESQQRGSATDVDESSQGSSGFWSAIEWLPCKDERFRPTQPGLFPLAHGITARVGRLRAYGNAIVAPLATEFIKAYLETRT